MFGSFRTVLAGAAALGLLAGAAQAAGDKVGEEGRERAREACREIAKGRDWKDIDMDVRDRRNDDNEIVVSVRGERDGKDRERECFFKDGEARFDDQD